jgi:hypothetical protein
MWISCHCGLADQRFQISMCRIQPMDGTYTTSSKPTLLYIDVAVTLISVPYVPRGNLPCHSITATPSSQPLLQLFCSATVLEKTKGLVKGSDKKWREYGLRMCAGLHVQSVLRSEVLEEKEFACLAHRTPMLPEECWLYDQELNSESCVDFKEVSWLSVADGWCPSALHIPGAGAASASLFAFRIRPARYCLAFRRS